MQPRAGSLSSNETLAIVAMRLCNPDRLRGTIHDQISPKYSKEFEYDHDNDNYSNYVENSVHVGDSYQTECAVARIYRKPSRYRGFFRHAVGNAVDYAKVFSRLHDAVTRVYDAAGNVIETHEHVAIFGSA